MTRTPPTLPEGPAGAARPPAAVAPGHRIVTSQHLVSPRSPELSEVEFGLAIVFNAYSRWMVRCMAAAGFADTAPLDVLVLHHVNSQDQEKKLADICFVLNVEDTHVVSYALKKLVGMGLIEGAKRGKEVFFHTTERGRQACERYRQVRETCLMPGFAGTEGENARLGDTAALLRTLSGRYDQAARAAAASVFTSLGAAAAPANGPAPAPAPVRRRTSKDAT
ncbi:winged helix DNA-binding protein [Ideonella sp. A 288]|uniref:winged helix DNA-binding protein n=1 Tax=Ideonella sp. A 288 TaxID=1962181 RepID=UPI000B4ABC2A|nr:winged helix DNA-binding protein [Ideonella sp. A 288]